jgi:DNA-binding CsgD family transcriptional regulator
VIPWDSLTQKLDELDAIRAQLREARAQERTASFFEILLAKRTVNERAHVGDAVVLSGGWCIVHWVHASRRGVAFYESLALLGIAMSIDGEFLLSWVDTSERRVQPGEWLSQTRSELLPSELKVLAEIGHGKSNGEIATALGLSPRTVKNHASRIYKKLGVLDRVQAALLARDLDLTVEG